MNDELDFGAAHRAALAEIEEKRAKDSIGRFLNAAMNMQPVAPYDALVVAYALQSAAKIKKGMGALGINQSRGKTYDIQKLKRTDRDAVIRICMLYAAKQIKRSIALAQISQFFSPDIDRKTLEKILTDGKNQWGGLVSFIEGFPGDAPNFNELLKKVKSKKK